MAQRKVAVENVGEVILAKRRGATSVKLSVTASGQIRVSLPWWLPYESGLAFAKSKKTWIQQQLAKYSSLSLQQDCLIGKAHRFNFEYAPNRSTKIQTHVSTTQITVRSSIPLEHASVQRAAKLACERALRQEAQKLLPQRLSTLADKYNFQYKAIKIRKMTSRWGSCSSQKTITLSYFLIQLPWALIDYVLIHELMHTKHLHHGKVFWESIEQIMPNTREMRKLIKSHKPCLQAF